jgi:hypothetical protein
LPDAGCTKSPGAEPDVTGIDLVRVPTVEPTFPIGGTGWPGPVPQLHRMSNESVLPVSGEFRFCHLAAGGLCDKAVFTLGEIFFLAARFVARIRLKLRIFDAPKPGRGLCGSARYLISRSESGLSQLPCSEKSFSTVEWATLRC